MANEELVIKLKKGVDDWNAWRRSNRSAPRVDLSVPDPDLSGADLSVALAEGLQNALWALGGVP